MHRWIVPIGVVCVVAVWAVRTAVADDEADRHNTVSQIESKLDAAATKLSGLERKSSASDVDDAQSYVREVERLVETLKSVKGSDSDADRMVSTYPGYIRDFRDPSEELKKLKNRQAAAAGYVRQCQAFDKEMTAKAASAKDDPGGAEELSEFAKSVGRKGEDLINEATRQWSEVEHSRDDVKRFSASEGRWSGIRSSLASSADGIAGEWREQFDRAKGACEEVMKRERHRDVERVLGQLANSRAGRADLRKRIDELLVTLGERVTEVESQSGTSNVNGALEISKELESQLERLKSAAGDDPESRRLAATWPAWIRPLQESLEALRELKLNQNRVDDSAGKCQLAESALQERIRAAVADPTRHEAALRELPDDADRVGAPIKTGVEKANDFDRSMEAWASKASAFSQSDGSWSRVSPKLRSSSEHVLAYWRTKLAEMNKACERLVLGREHPDVKRAVDEMGRDTRSAGETYRGLRDEFNRWKGEVDKLRDFSAQDVEDIRKAFCAATHPDDLDEVNAVADRWASQISALYGSINGSAERIKRSADELIAKKRALKAAPMTKAAVDAILASLEKLKDYQLRGSNNPLLKAQAQYGVDKHRSMQSGCDKTELTITSEYCRNPNPRRSDCRLDCVKRCTIVEFKPTAAEELGTKQAVAYKEGLELMFEKRGIDMFAGDFAHFRQCVAHDPKALLLTIRVEPYDFCPPLAKLAPALDRVERSIPAEAE